MEIYIDLSEQYRQLHTIIYKFFIGLCLCLGVGQCKHTSNYACSRTRTLQANAINIRKESFT